MPPHRPRMFGILMLDASGSGWNKSNSQQYNTSQASCPAQNKLVCILMAGAGSQPTRKGGRGRGGRAVVRRSKSGSRPCPTQRPPPPPPPPPPHLLQRIMRLLMPMPTQLLMRWQRISMSLQLRKHCDD
jgi:hypothetical protein